jgi:site-specific DNA recombinase
MSLPEPSVFVGAPPPLRDIPTVPLVDMDPLIDASVPPGQRAVVYLRVSSKGQVNTDYDPEGLSIPAQRIACMRKAEQLGMTVVAEYTEMGQSATEMSKRLAFQEMLARIRTQKDVDAVIVYKLSRFARNRLDDAVVMSDLQARGVSLISATEQIDATPVGQLMHGILAAFNEYRSREDGADIAYKMSQKAKNGGTLGKAPLGYLNVSEIVDGRRINTVGIDGERAPHVKTAFELYASGKFTFQDIADELTDRGLVTRQTLKHPSGPVSDSKIHLLLRDRYYLGEIKYKDEVYAGRHEPLVDAALFDKVQALLDSRGYASERRRVHEHYLKGTLWCGRCRLEDKVNRRMIIMRLNRPNDRSYEYFFCRGAQDHTCDAPYSNIDRVEDALQEHYKTIRLSADFIDAVKGLIEQTMADQSLAQTVLRDQTTKQLERLATQEDNLLNLAADGELDTARIRVKLRELARRRTELEGQLANVQSDLAPGAAYIDMFLQLLERPDELYRQASDETRRELNQAIFERVYVLNEEIVGDSINTPLRELLAAERGWLAMDTGASRDLAIISAQNRESQQRPLETEKGAVHDDSLDQFLSSLLPDPSEEVGNCSKPSLVPLEGLEPPTVSLGRNCSSIELQRRILAQFTLRTYPAWSVAPRFSRGLMDSSHRRPGPSDSSAARASRTVLVRQS